MLDPVLLQESQFSVNFFNDLHFSNFFFFFFNKLFENRLLLAAFFIEIVSRPEIYFGFFRYFIKIFRAAYICFHDSFIPRRLRLDMRLEQKFI